MESSTDKIMVDREEYEKLRVTIEQQAAEIAALEYRVETLLSR
jgi:hypothetical protein